MKKVAKFVSAAVVSTAFMGTVASAATCDGSITISNTGPGSNNTISCMDVSNIVLNCNNNVVVATVNTQNGTTGSANTSSNTTGGNAVSGQVVNNNGNDVTVGGGCEQLAATSTPETPGMGGGSGNGGGAGAFTPDVLPDTATSSPILAALGVVAAATGVAGVSRMAVVVYRKALR